MKLFLDIETIPTQRDDVRDYLSASLREETMKAMEAVTAPANYKDAEKIAQFCADKRAALQAEFAANVQKKIDATGLDGAFGQVFCIGWALDDDEPQTIYGTNERTVLEEFDRRLRIEPKELHQTTVVGFNVVAFDLRFLCQRYIVHGIKPPFVIQRAAQAKPWESEKVFDCMVQWAGVGNRISLDKLCLALSIPSPKGDMDGSNVGEYVQAGRHEEVSAYCRKDVEATREVHRRMTFAVDFEDVPV